MVKTLNADLLRLNAHRGIKNVFFDTKRLRRVPLLFIYIYETCPMDGNCNVESIIYQAEVTSQTTRETYIGLCDTPFKLRFRNHTSSFRNERYRNATELSKHVWNLKDQNILYNIKWRKIKQARSYSNVTKKCNLCLWEKYFILCKPEMSSLNNRNELVSCCRHSRKFLLRNVIT